MNERNVKEWTKVADSDCPTKGCRCEYVEHRSSIVKADTDIGWKFQHSKWCAECGESR